MVAKFNLKPFYNKVFLYKSLFITKLGGREAVGLLISLVETRLKLPFYDSFRIGGWNTGLVGEGVVVGVVGTGYLALYLVAQ